MRAKIARPGEPGWSEWLGWHREISERVNDRNGRFKPEVRARFDAVMNRLLATRAINCLINQGVDPTGDLAAVRLMTDEQLLATGNFGKKALKGLRELAPYEGPPDLPPLDDDDPPQVSRDVMDAAGNLLPTHTPSNGWLPIETAPKDGRQILLTSSAGLFVVIAEWVQPLAPAGVPPPDGWWRYGSFGHSDEADEEREYYSPAWWQPLPGPPPEPLGRYIDPEEAPDKTT